MTTSSVTKALISKYFNGDEDAFNEVMRVDDPEAYSHWLKYYNTTVHWKDIDLHVRCHPEYHEVAIAWIRYVLGYLPQPEAYMPFLAFIQTLIENAKNSMASDDQFLEELFSCVRQIRNKDIKHGGWLLNFTYGQAHYERYNNELAFYKHAARERLCKFLGYEPLLEFSLDAEVFLRQIFAEDYFHLDMPYCNADYKAANIVRYREAFLTLGEEMADTCDLALPATGHRRSISKEI